MGEPRGTATAEFAGQLDQLIDYFAMEFDMSVAQVVGVLEVAKMNVLMQQMADEDDDEGAEEERTGT